MSSIQPKWSDSAAGPTVEELTAHKMEVTPLSKLSKFLAPQYPLAAEVVLPKVARLLSAPDLLKLRKTCVAWNQMSVPNLRKRHSPIRLLTLSGFNFRLSTEEFLGTLPTSTATPFPFTKYNIGQDSHSDDDGFQLELKTIFSNIEPTVTFVHLDWTPWALPIKDLRKIIFEGMPRLEELELWATWNEYGDELEPFRDTGNTLPLLSNLKRLEIQSGFDEGERSTRRNLVFKELRRLTTDLILSTPNLSSLTLQKTHAASSRYGLLATLSSLQRSEANLDKLKSLGISQLDATHLRTLIELATQDQNALRLKVFVAVVTCPDRQGAEALSRTAQLFHNFLTTQASSLKYLKLKFMGEEDEEVEFFGCLMPEDVSSRDEGGGLPSPIHIPRMERLIQLELIRSEQKRIPLLFGGDGDDPASTFPLLNRVYYKLLGYRPRRDSNYSRDMDQFFHPGVTELCVVLNIQRPVMHEIIARMRTCFPSVTRLELLDDYSAIPSPRAGGVPLSNVWTIWSALTVLHVKGVVFRGRGLDEWLTGVDRRQLSGLREKLDACTCTSVRKSFLALLQKNYKTRPGLSDLQHLKELRIRVGYADDDDVREPLLTNVGGYTGLGLASPDLQVMEIQGSFVNTMTEECKKYIRSVIRPYAVLLLGGRDSRD